MVATEQIARVILALRGQRVMLVAELPALYSVATKVLNRGVKRNAARFPEDFTFRLTRAETAALDRSQYVTGSQKYRDPRLPPCAFTEHGAIMTAIVLSSARAVEISVCVVRAFVQLRELPASNKELSSRFAQLEARLNNRIADHDEVINDILSAIRRLMSPLASKRRGIGFTANLNTEK